MSFWILPDLLGGFEIFEMLFYWSLYQPIKLLYLYELISASIFEVYPLYSDVVD